MQKRCEQEWLVTSKGEPRGYIEAGQLSEVWFHTGTRCNLSCSFCLEGAGPKSDRIEFITLSDALPLIDEAVKLGVNKLSFTGGEPFVNPEILDVLDYALDRLPCLVLTNGTEPIRNRLDRVMAFADKSNPLSFRVSLDHPDPAVHDEVRGEGKFAKALDTLGKLHGAGFHVSIARHMEKNEDTSAVDQAYQTHFADAGLSSSTTIIKFPDLLPPGSLADVPEITENCMTTYLTAEQRDAFMCKFSRMVVKKQGRCRVYACTLVDDDDEYAMGNTLVESLSAPVLLRHHRCFSCFSCGASCSEGH